MWDAEVHRRTRSSVSRATSVEDPSRAWASTLAGKGDPLWNRRMRPPSTRSFVLSVLLASFVAAPRPCGAQSEAASTDAVAQPSTPAESVVVVEPPSPASPTSAPSPGAAPVVTMATEPASRHAIYVEATSLIVLDSIGVQYEYRPIRGFSLSFGLGLSVAVGIVVNARAFGGQMLLHGLVGGDSPSSFEIAAGLSVMTSDATLIFSDTVTREVGVAPALFLGYRFQPLDGGALFRVGGAWSYAFGIGLSCSVGVSF